MMVEKLKIAKIIAAHGIKGNVVIKLFVDDHNLLFNSQNIFDKANNNLKIKKIGLKKDNLIVNINDVNNRNEAELLVGKELFINKENLPELNHDKEIYHHDLIGLNAHNLNGQEIAKVIAMHNFGAGDIIEIKFNDSKKELMLPFKTDIITEIHVDQGYLVIDLKDWLN